MAAIAIGGKGIFGFFIDYLKVWWHEQSYLARLMRDEQRRFRLHLAGKYYPGIGKAVNC